jgi:hypothetical protein
MLAAIESPSSSLINKAAMQQVGDNLETWAGPTAGSHQLEPAPPHTIRLAAACSSKEPPSGSSPSPSAGGSHVSETSAKSVYSGPAARMLWQPPARSDSSPTKMLGRKKHVCMTTGKDAATSNDRYDNVNDEHACIRSAGRSKWKKRPGASGTSSSAGLPRPLPLVPRLT